ncbi:MAG TPA: hypothetical protein VMK13_12600 [Streptosporangiaceae bacterium]|nr:hypothetical protein [Streptosporangiaceae bacterium]
MSPEERERIGGMLRDLAARIGRLELGESIVSPRRGPDLAR